MTPWSEALLESLINTQLVKKFLNLWNIKIHDCVHWSLYSARRILSTTSQPISLNFILKISFYLRLYLPSGFPTSLFRTSHLSHTCYTPRQSHSPWLDHSYILIIGEACKVGGMKLLSTQSSLDFRHFLPLGSKYSPPHLVLKHPQSMFS
jgi:hypothetical protein